MLVAVRVFKGNTSDSKTIPDQINLLRNDFLIKKVTLVGDRAMFPQAQKDDLAEQISYISAIGIKTNQDLAQKRTITDVFIRRRFTRGRDRSSKIYT